jgi:hypothetical protein
MVSVSILGNSVDLGIKEMFFISAMLFVWVNITSAYSTYGNLWDAMIAGSWNSLFNLEEFNFNWFEKLGSGIPLVGDVLAVVGMPIDWLINGFMNLEISGIKILRMFGIITLWAIAGSWILKIVGFSVNYQTNMMRV